MLLDIFSPEITALESELLQLQTLMESKRKEQSMLKELGFEANSTISAIALLKEKVQAVKAEAIASLKTAVLNLFIDGDDGGNKLTEPTPPTDPNGADLLECTMCGADLTIEENKPEFAPAAISGICRDCESKMEEAEANYGIGGVEDEEGEEEPALIFHPDNASLAWLADGNDNGKLTALIGFSRKGVARNWEKFIEPMALATELEEAKLMEGYKYELRCYGMLAGQLAQLSGYDFSKNHSISSSEIGTAIPPQPARKIASTKQVSIGDRVTRLLTPSEVFEVTSFVSTDNTVFAKSVLNGERALFNLDDLNILAPGAETKSAKVLLLGDQFHGQVLPIFDTSDAYLNLKAPTGQIISYKRDVVEILDAEIESLADPTDPESHPAIQVGDRVLLANALVPELEGVEMEVVRFISDRAVNCLLPDGNWRPFLIENLRLVDFEKRLGGQTAVPMNDTHSILSIGDEVKILSDRYPQFAALIGSVVEIIAGTSHPICVKAVRGMKFYQRQELKLISKHLPLEEKELMAAGAELEF